MREAEQLKKLVEYLKKNLKKGYTLDSLKWALIGQGYSRTAVEKAMEMTTKELAREAPVLKEKPVITHEVIDENDKPVRKRSFWKWLMGSD